MSMRRTMVSICCAAIPILSPGGASAQQSPANTVVRPYESIEGKASVATPDDPDSIRALADAIFSFYYSVPRMPNLMEGMVRDRLVRAEVLFRQGKSPGVQEEDVVKTFNFLADTLSGVPHARTSLSQLRILRMSLALWEPRFMGAGIARQDTLEGQPVNARMGPLQALHLMTTLVNLKLLNPDFQVSPEEWEQYSLEKVTREFQTDQARVAGVKSNAAGSVGQIRLRSYSPDRRRELEESVVRKLTSFTVDDGMALMTRALITLGLD